MAKSNVARLPRGPNNTLTRRRDTGYRFKDRDPALDELCQLIHESGLTVQVICEAVTKATSGAYSVSPSTVNNWLNGMTRRPQNYTMTWVAFALGYERSWSKR